MNQQEQETLKPGDKIVLVKHINESGEVFDWNGDMERYVGRTATVRQIRTNSKFGLSARVDVDNEQWAWHLVVQRLAVELPARSSFDPGGCKCNTCGDFVPYAEKPETFVCYPCRQRP